MPNAVDKAIIDWANDQLEAKGHPRDAVGLRFGTWVGCYSSWTCEYGVEPTIDREHGPPCSVKTWSFPSVLRALPEYVAAQEELERQHAEYHSWDEHYSIGVDF